MGDQEGEYLDDFAEALAWLALIVVLEWTFRTLVDWEYLFDSPAAPACA